MNHENAFPVDLHRDPLPDMPACASAPPAGRRFTLTREVLSYPLTAEVTVLPMGIHVLFTGGCLPHIGAVTVLDPAGSRTGIQFPSHKDQAVSDFVSDAIYRRQGGPVTVVAGVHYDDATKEQIRQIMAAVAEMTEELLQKL